MRLLTSLPSSLSAFLILASSIPVTLGLDLNNLPEGLSIEITKSAQCIRKSQKGDELSVHYRGTLVDGIEFDSSIRRGRPFSFTIGVGNVIKGWDIGMMDMCPGEERRLTIAPELAYGDRGVGKIPPGSTLLFDTSLLEIKGVPKEEESASSSSEQASETATSSVAESAAASAAPTADPGEEEANKDKGSEGGPKDQDPNDNGECRLLGPFAILVQGALGLLALLSLVWKRWRERPQRPIKIWFFDVSKQVFGSVLIHLANLFMSMLSSGDFDVKKAGTYVQEDPSTGRQPNPCSFYLLNLAIDTTIGIPILVLLLRILHGLFLLTPLANPPESLKSGNYGHPPRITWWLKQSIIYFLGLFGMKLCVFVLFQLFPFLGWVGDWALRWTEGKEWVQITFVMLIFPLIMNAAQYYIIDSFIKDPAESYDYAPVGEHEGAHHEENEGLIRPGGRRSEDDAEELLEERREIEENRKSPGMRTKEANPTPLPTYTEYDHEGRPGSSSVGSRSIDNDDKK